MSTTTEISKPLLKRLRRSRDALARDLLEQADACPGPASGHPSLDCRDVAARVAGAWLLGCTVVRALEDRGLFDCRLIVGIGPQGLHRELSARDHLLMIFRELSRNPWTRELFALEHNLLWRIAPSVEAAKFLLEVFRGDTDGFCFDQPDTRWLGDLYQKLNDGVRKDTALCQTPDFVGSFILDRTLTPALEKFGLEATTVLDPTCGTGHFLLDAFERLYQLWRTEHPELPSREAAARSLGAVHGVDINPMCVALARFRLTLAYADKAGMNRPEALPKLPLNVVVADSLTCGVERPPKPRRAKPPLPKAAELKLAIEALYKTDGLTTRPSSFRRQLKGRVRHALVSEYRKCGQHDVAEALATAPLSDSLLNYDPTQGDPRYEIHGFAKGRQVAVTTWGVPDEPSWDDPRWVDPVCTALFRAADSVAARGAA